MTIWYLLAFPAFVVIFLTSVARLDDIRKNQKEARWIIRRAGFFFSAIYAILRLAMPFVEAGREVGTTWVTCIGVWGWAWVWLTTPGMPPWHMFITGEHRKEDAVARTFYQRVRHELAGFIYSFTHTTPKQQREKKEEEERRSGDDRRRNERP